MYKTVFIILLLIFTRSVAPAAENHRVDFIVQTSALPPASKVFITGNQSGLGSWSGTGLALKKTADLTWRGEVTVPAGTDLQFKITRGNWETEMVDSNGIELAAFTLVVQKDTTLRIYVNNWRDISGIPTVISDDRFRNKAGRIELFENWKFHAGDNPDWALEKFDDRDWENLSTFLPEAQLPGSSWTGIGWFRLHINIDPSLLNLPLGLDLLQAGASEIYLNGKLLYRIGTVSADAAREKISFNREPLYITFPARQNNVLGVRYSNTNKIALFGSGSWTGFRIILFRDMDDFIRGRLFDIRHLTIYQLLFTIIPFTLAFLHLMIFIFNRREKANLYYAISMAGFAIIAFTDFGRSFTGNQLEEIWLNRINFLAINTAILFGLLTSYSARKNKIPFVFYIFLAASLGFILWFLLYPARLLQTFFYIFLIFVAVELIRQSFRPKRVKNYIIGTGVVMLAVSVILQILINLDLLGSISPGGSIYLYGVLALGLAMSINLAKNFADINQKFIRQEREKRETEIQQRLLEADNLRKTQELEEARKLQLSMLPSELPVHPEYEVDTFMRTASEVGGDYYDFQMTADMTLTIALGDATGHGIKAGILVALIKSLFNTSANTFYLPDFFKLCSNMIRQMSLGNLYMALMLVRLRGNKMTLSVAGMPPIYIYRSEKQIVEEAVQKAMPLGGPGGITYTQQNFDIKTGDTILMMTDGYYELFDPADEMLDLGRVKTYFKHCAAGSPKEIIDYMIKQADLWRKQRPQGDDISFVVIKKK
jgi:serine phosphatase RsbU (regulator of sigma subunit)